jgi:membrane peptidoglycan carboxypeptidase
MLMADLPSPINLEYLMDTREGLLNHPTQLFDRSGEEVIATLRHPAAAEANYLFIPDDYFEADHPRQGNANPENRSVFSQELISATIGASDPDFWQHSGFTISGINDNRHPTLAQQLVAELLLWEEPADLTKAIRERFLAAQITHRYGRAQILEWHLNAAEYGPLIYGADAAARVYFGKPASALDLSEAVWLAVLAKNPHLPPTPDEHATILETMQKLGYITQTEADAAQAQRPIPTFPAAAYESLAPAFSDYVLEQLSQDYNLARIQRGGLNIITTLDPDLQIQATCAAYAHLERSGTKVEDALLPTDLDCEAERLLPTLSGASGSPEGQLAVNVLILDPTNGHILAYVADPNSNLDPASFPGHTPGSLLTPFIYLTSFTRGFTPSSLVWDISTEEVPAEIDNLDEEEHGPMRLRLALANDYLVPAAQIMEQVGAENILRTLQQFGLYSSTDEPVSASEHFNSSILLDGGEVTLLKMVQAMGIFANQGILAGIPRNHDTPDERVDPVVVLELRDQAQRSWAQPPAGARQPILSSQLAYLMTHILSDEAARWSKLGHPNALEIGRPAAVKLGSTAAGQDVWTVGYTPQMVVGVWVGRLSPEDAPALSTQLPAALWHALMQYAQRGLPSLNWARPAGITTLEVCDPSGLLPSANCPTIVSEVFLAGTEPIQVDNLYQAVQVNRETGLLATINTPAELIEEKIYLKVPEAALSWARQVGIPTPPETYDLVTSVPQYNPDVMITSPEMFAVVGGKVSITGNAAGTDFARYRIQVGQGLNPSSWIQIGDDQTKPVRDHELLRWDTQDYRGLYTLQLLVEREDRQVETSTIYVTVDNQAPEVAILYPKAGQIVELKTITIQVAAEDDLRLAKVRIFMDNRLLAQIDQAPYSTVWQTTPGEHTLKVEASDQAGNLSAASVRYSSPTP